MKRTIESFLLRKGCILNQPKTEYYCWNITESDSFISHHTGAPVPKANCSQTKRNPNISPVTQAKLSAVPEVQYIGSWKPTMKKPYPINEWQQQMHTKLTADKIAEQEQNLPTCEFWPCNADGSIEVKVKDDEHND